MAVDEGYVEPESTEVLVKYLREPYQQTLRYAHAGDAGADLTAAEDVTLRPFERVLVPTGIAIALPAGYVGLVHPRSGLAVKQGVTVLNAPGTIDAGYRGEIKVPIWSFSASTFFVASIIRASSPPEATLLRGFNASPALADI